MKTGAIIGASVVIVLVIIGGLVFYMSALPPNIIISDINIDPILNERVVAVIDERRVSISDSFSYYSKNGGTYNLIFDNTISVFSNKSVDVSYTDKGKQYNKKFLVPSGTRHSIEVFAYPNSSISGQMQVSGGSGSDIDFVITTKECTQKVKFSFSLFNSGHVAGDVTVKLLAGDKSYWSNNYVLKSDEKISRSDSETIPNCKDLKIVISEQKSTDYIRSLVDKFLNQMT